MVYKHLGLTQEKFANQLGFGRHMIQKYIKGAEPSMRFLAAMEESFPEININYIRNREDNMLVADGGQDTDAEYRLCESCKEKERIIDGLEKRISDKEEIINGLRDQVQLYKEKLGECEDLSKQA